MSDNSEANHLEVSLPWNDAPAAEDEQVSKRWRLGPELLAYLVGPPACVFILILMRFDLIAHESAWLWLGVFIAIPAFSSIVDHAYRAHPSMFRLQVRVAVHAAAVTTVIYLTGWGPALSVAFAFIAIENVAHGGSRVWKITAGWSLAGILVGQIAITLGWAPSELPVHEANGLAAMGAFLMIVIIRMVGATMEQKENAEASTRLSGDRFRSLIQNSSDVTLVILPGGNCAYVSPAVTELTGYQPEDLVGTTVQELVHPDEQEWVFERLGAQLLNVNVNETAPVQFRLRGADGGWRDVEAVVTDQRDRPSVGGFVVNLRDITERKEFEQLLAYRALHDPLTGLANRQLILDRAEQMLARARRTFEPIAAYFIDLDNFKDTNDSLGHEAGDRLLEAVAARFVSLFRAGDTVGRLGGDEFLVLIDGATIKDGPLIVAERIRASLHEPIIIPGFEDLPISITASIGIATGDRTSAHDLLRDADLAMYRAKAQGRDGWVLFDPDMQSAAVARIELRSDLDSALAGGQFFLVYQPIFDLANGAVRGVEALIRWRHRDRGVLGPNDFIPILEESGMIVDVGRWVLEEACVQAASWQALGHSISMSVNVSLRQLASEQFVYDVRRALASSDLDAGSLLIEVTESTIMQEVDATRARLSRLKDQGVQIAIDDFGTGYSSLAHLRQLPVDVLKIDKSFVAGIDGRADSLALIHTVIELGRTLGLISCAEGVEEHSQLDALRNERCDRAQGFLFSQPVPPDQIEALLVRAADGRVFGLPSRLGA
jgi:diguanylate cyclase (GGDEF)-like protein/PAS domain S-box-containing protein